MRTALALLCGAALFAAAAPASASEPLTLRLQQPASEQPLALQVTGSYGESPAAVMIRDGAVGGLVGLGAGALIGVAADSGHVGRDAAIGAATGILAGIVFGVYDAQSGPHISISSDRTVSVGQRF